MKHALTLPRLVVCAMLLIAALFRLWLVATDGAAFESDEAVVGLMARHITQGRAIPTFYYGQAYMGSLDAILAAGGFTLLGESVHTIRIVQLALYLLSLVAAYRLALELTRSARIAGMALLLLAIPTTLGALYTTISLGGYNELVLLGNLILLVGWQVTAGGRREVWRWGVLGLAAGVGWWVNGAIVTPCAVVGLLALRYFSVRQWRAYALAGAAFVIGSAPWWLYNLRHDWAALDFLTGGFDPAPGVERISPAESLIGLLLLGLPALYGLRAPWAAGFDVTPGLVAAALVYLVLLVDLIARRISRRAGHPHLNAFDLSPTSAAASGCAPPLHHVEKGVRGGANAAKKQGETLSASAWVWLVFGVFAILFTLSSFSDATGRYLMPVWVPAAIGLAIGLDRLWRASAAGWMAAAGALAILLAFQAGSVIRAARTDTGLTPQLVERLRTPADYDTALIAFLEHEGYTRGYASYWTSFRIMFRAHESIILDTALPYDEKGFRPGNDRYPPYGDRVAQADRVVWITQNFPDLDAEIARRLAAAGIDYRVRDFGPYRVYEFAAHIAPADLGLSSERPLAELAAEDP